MATSNLAFPGGLAGLAQLKELRQRLLFVLFALFVYRVASHIPVPGINPAALAEMFNQQRGSILDMFNMFSGGALQRFSVIALGIMPYISASIIMQLLTVIEPRLKQLKKKVKRVGVRSPNIPATVPCYWLLFRHWGWRWRWKVSAPHSARW